MQLAQENLQSSALGLADNSNTENVGLDFKHINEEQFYMFESIVHSLQIEKENPLLENVSAEHLPPVKVKIKFLEFPDMEINEEDFINNKNHVPLDDNLSHSTKISDLLPDIHKQLEGINEEGLITGIKRLKSSSLADPHEEAVGNFPNHQNGNSLKLDRNNFDLSGKSLIFTMTPKQLIASIQKSPVSVSIFRYTNKNYEKDPASKVGQKWITLTEDFCTAVLRSSNKNMPKATLREKYQIQNMCNEKTGTITLSFRLCCFGSVIMTQMQMDYSSQEYNFKYLPNCEAFKCYTFNTQSTDFESKLEKMNLMPLLTDSDNILNIKKEFTTTNINTEKPVNWKLYNRQCFSNLTDAQIEITSKKKTNGMEGLLFSPKCQCANILEALYKKNKVQSVPSMLERKQQNLSVLKSRGIGNPTDSKLAINRKQSKLSVKCTQSKQDITEPTKKKSRIIADLNRTTHDINDQIEKCVSISPKESLPLNQITNITDPTTHTIMNLENNRKLSSVLETPNKTDQKRETKSGKSFKRKKFLYDYSTGVYPGVRFGHKTCLEGPRYVPKTMGWLWNIPDHVTGLKKKPGWKPGLISKTISKMIKIAKGLTVSKAQASARKTYSSKKIVLKTIPPTSTVSEIIKKVYDSDEEIPPTLQLYKKGRVYCIQMNTIKEDSEDEQDPLKFKILPDDDEKSVRTSKSSIAIHFVAPGALYKKPIKPDVAEVCTQYSEINFGIEEILPPKNNTKKKNRKEKNKKVSALSLSASNKSKRILWDDSSVPTEVSKF